MSNKAVVNKFISKKTNTSFWQIAKIEINSSSYLKLFTLLYFNSLLKPTDMGEILTPAQWDDLRIHLKRKHPYLNDDDMPYYEAEEQDLLCMIEFKLQNYNEDRLQTNHNIGVYSSAK